MRHGTCVRRRLSAHRAGAAPHSAVAWGRRRYPSLVNANRIELYSPLPPAECVSRLTSACDADSSLRTPLEAFLGSCGFKPVLGRVTDTSLRLRKRIDYRNSFQTRLTAAIRPEGAGTVISGSFSMHPFVRVFTIIWFAGVILIGGSMFAVALGSFISHASHRPDNAWLGLAGPPLMLAFGYGLFRLGRYLARREASFITDFLIQVLNANTRNA